MHKNWPFIVLGFWVAVVPFTGFPGSWKTVFIVVSGLAISSLAFLRVLYIRKTQAARERRGPEEYTQDHDVFQDSSSKETS